MKTTTRLLALAAAIGLQAAQLAQAQTADFSVWDRAGDVVVAAGLPSLGAVLSTAASASGESSVAGGDALMYYQLEPALALNAGVLPADTFEGSGLRQSFSLAAGVQATYSFNWTLSTQGYDPAYADRAFVVIDGGLVAPLGAVSASTVFGNFATTFTTPGPHSIAVLVMDVNDSSGVSVLGLSNLAVRVSAVPEVGSLALMLAGLGVVGAAARRGRGRSAAQAAE